MPVVNSFSQLSKNSKIIVCSEKKCIFELGKVFDNCEKFLKNQS